MSMTSLLSLGANAMFAAQTQLQTTGHNIANASMPGYSRQEASLATVQGRYTGAGYVGRGVTVQTIERAVDSFKTNEVALTASTAAADKTRMTLLSQLEGFIGTGTSGIGQAATEFFNALSDVAAAPNDPSARQVALARADDLASMFRSTSAQIESLQSSVKQDVESTVDTVNSLATRIAELNEAISGTNGGSHTANDLLDQRDQLIQELSGHVQVTRVEQDDGSMNLFIGGGQSLVLGRQANALEAVPDPFDATRVNVNVKVAGESRLLGENALGGGTLAGLMRFQDDDLAQMRNGLGRLAAALTGAVNAQQEAGFDLNGASGSAMFTALTGNVTPSRLNTGATLANPTGLITLSDPAALKDAEYELKVVGAGAYTLTRTPGGQPQSVADGDTVDGMQLNLAALAGQDTGNKFLLQPVSQVAAGVKMVLTDPADLAAANSVVLQGGSGNTGSATVKSVVVDGSASPLGTVIQFGTTTADGGRNYTVNGVASTTPWKPGGKIDANGMSIVLSGVPAQNDTFTANATTQWGANNGNALSLADLMNGKLVSGDSSAESYTFTDAYSHLLADLGVRSQSAETAYEVSNGVAERAQEQLGASTGVNLDEEAAKLLQYQQAYQAASKILQVAQKVFDTVLSLGQ